MPRYKDSEVRRLELIELLKLRREGVPYSIIADRLRLKPGRYLEEMYKRALKEEREGFLEPPGSVPVVDKEPWKQWPRGAIGGGNSSRQRGNWRPSLTAGPELKGVK